MHAALGRLTENEKACLRRRLIPQTAKEMAIDLGISPHAVEKRLKMARTKLGLGSSLEVARLLAAMESGYEQSVPQASDLTRTAPRGQTGQRTALIIAGITFMLLSTFIIAMLLTGQDTRQGATYEEATSYLEASFAKIDRDGSGFVDAADAPKMTVQGPGDMAPRPMAPSDASLWIERLDANKDGKVSRDEWVGGLRPGLMQHGIPPGAREKLAN